MKLVNALASALLLSSLLIAQPLAATANSRATVSLEPFAALEKAARARTGSSPRSNLAGMDKLKGIAYADPLETGEVPNYLLALAAHTDAAPQFAGAVRTFLYGGTVVPETKMAMAMRIAQTLNSPYAFAHSQRWLRRTERGQELISKMRTGSLSGLALGDQIALSYAESLTRGVNAVSDTEFQKARTVYNDSQLVELTMTVCFFNYFARLSEALNLPVEQWTLEQTSFPASPPKYLPPVARVALISDEELNATAAAVTASKAPTGAGLGLGIANSQRAMLRAPALSLAWRTYGSAVREKSTIGREMQLHISFAVSMLNGCRYCTLHQVLGLRRLGIDAAKLVAMKKDDSLLSARELTAVTFARKLTRDPSTINDEDYAKLKAEFGERGALEVVLQTCAFSFMNRFTDGLKLPSEDEAIRVYHEVYGDRSISKQ